MYLSIGGIEQWVQIGGELDRPILLYLHGGPGGSSRPAAAAWRSWEQYFRVVHWDQRGTGLTFKRNGDALTGSLTIDRMVRDGIELARFLKTRFSGSKIVLVGHSWGSILGIQMIRCWPELFAAYVGTGQVVNMRRNEQVNYAKQLTQAEAANNENALEALRALGPPPYAERGSIRVLREWADKLAPGYGDDVRPVPNPLPADFTTEDRNWLIRGFHFSGNELFGELGAIDLPSLGLEFDVPIFFFEGTADQQTPIELAEEYLGQIIAPKKAFVRFEGYHHFFVMNRPNEFLSALIRYVLPDL